MVSKGALYLICHKVVIGFGILEFGKLLIYKENSLRV